MKEIWVTTNELAAIQGITTQAVFKATPYNAANKFSQIKLNA